LLGPNGSGKTTTLKMVAGLIHPTAGKIRVCGHDLATAREQAIRMLSYLPQRVEFPKNLSAREIVDFYAGLRSVSDKAVQDALQRTCFNGFADRPVAEYSGGMVQRLGLAVASLPQAPLLLLDEPTVSLDPAGVQDFRQYVLDHKNSGRSVIFTTHLLGEAERLADRIGILVSGRLVMMEEVERVRLQVHEHGSLEAFYLELVNDDKRTQCRQVAAK
jgi:Cu-processing system ATP-binding protein